VEAGVEATRAIAGHVAGIVEDFAAYVQSLGEE
jgi:hypothetical protein